MSEEGTVSFVEMGSGEVDRTARFFSALFGWTYTPSEDGRGGWFETAGGRVGLHDDDPDWGMVPFLCVRDVQVAAQRVRDLGGQAEEVVAAPGFGRFSNCRDPQGMRFGLHQPD